MLSVSNVVEADKLALMALCRIKGISWYLLAREAMRPDGLQRLLHGKLTERSKEADESSSLLSKSLGKLDDLIQDTADVIKSAADEGIKLVTVLDPDYPLNLRTIFNRPPFLFYRGELNDADAWSVAVVGTRKPSPAGLAHATEMATLLANARVTVLSGLARGIDTAAHEATLAAGGRTIAVLGSGLRKIYPPENTSLAERIAEAGAVVSQFWPNAAPTSYSFPWRNITMSGLGQGTVVIEASETSGAKMQARFAIEHGKKVFLLKSLVQSHEWAQRYLQLPGVTEVNEVKDILDHLKEVDQIRESAKEKFQLSLGLNAE